MAPIATVNAAVGRTVQSVTLHEPPTWATDNRGLASLHDRGQGGRSFVVPMVALGSRLELAVADCMFWKVDAEGAELDVIEGGAALLDSGRMRHIVLEEFAPYPGPTHRRLEASGFQIFNVEPHLTRLRLLLTQEGFVRPPTSRPTTWPR